ncbi:hypothetical protein L3i22_051370 [Actinoplanes sp. L3-i22]|nr:hypothetical protein L3i22_051370 [Actinoplanes sp. L3-i22]
MVLVSITGPAAAADYPSFDGVTTLHLNGSAAVVPVGPAHRAVLRLTGGRLPQAGSAWDHDRLDLTESFGTSFYVMLDGHSGAHGISFALQSTGPRALAVKRGATIEFDDAKNSVALNLNNTRVMATEANIPLIDSPFLARVTYDATTRTLRAYLSAPDADEQLVVDRTVDLPAQLGADRAWAGFTATATDPAATQDILSWESEPPTE